MKFEARTGLFFNFIDIFISTFQKNVVDIGKDPVELMILELLLAGVNQHP
jgi:hypothetical protein